MITEIEKTFMCRSASVEHQRLVELAWEIFGGAPIIVRGSYNATGQYFPDISTDDTDIECELIKNNLNNKILKGNNGKKKILIIGYPKMVFEFFDEIYGLDTKDNSLIRLK